MRQKTPSTSLAYIPPDPSYRELVRAVDFCKACPLYERATQAVFGEGPIGAPLFLVGEQPGDQEDKQGHPFVGPAGRVLDAALEAAEIPRDQVYVTNVVKHFKWEPRGKRRMHSKPNASEIEACHGWLRAEVELIEPQVIVCLGATAAQTFLGRSFRITKGRGQPMRGASFDWSAEHIIATYHPSALLRMMDDHDAYLKAKSELADDLAVAHSLVTFRRTRGRVPRFRERRPSRSS